MSEATSWVLPAPLGRASAYVRLGKLQVWQHWWAIPIVWSLLSPSMALTPRAVAILALVLLSMMGLMAATMAFDDVSGFRDGTDARNYLASNKVRNIRRKPLLTGELSEAQALRFAYAAALFGFASGVAPYLIGARWSPWVLTVFIFGGLAAIQYSSGLRISYAGGGELLLVLATACTIVLPYASLTGTMSGHVLVEGVLLGVLLLTVPLFSNTSDAANDRLAHRRTLAASLSATANDRLIVAVFAAGFGLVVVGAAIGLLPTWLLLLMLPAWALQLRQLRDGVGRRRWLEGRRVGFRAFDFAAAALLVANLLAWT